MLLGGSRHEQTNHPDPKTKDGSGDCQVYETSNNLSEPRRVAYLSGIRAKLDGSVQRSRDGLTVGQPQLTQLIFVFLLVISLGMKQR